jgi:hypothetical protein
MSSTHWLDHLPKNPFCPACQQAKAYQTQGGRCDPATKIKPSGFGDLLLADHMIISNDDHSGKRGEKARLLVLDVATDWVELPCKTKDSR